MGFLFGFEIKFNWLLSHGLGYGAIKIHPKQVDFDVQAHQLKTNKGVATATSTAFLSVTLHHATAAC